MPNLPGTNHDGLRQAADQVAAADLGVRFIRRRVADPIAILISSAVRSPSMSDLLLGERDDRLVHFVAADLDGPGGHDAAERDHRDLGGPPPTSTTMFPVGSSTGSPAPIAAAIGSSMM